jgi:hypothetical protein
MSEITCFYRQPSATSDLGRHRGLSIGLPADPEALSAIVRGLLVHNFTAKVKVCFDLYPELRPPADAVAR